MLRLIHDVPRWHVYLHRDSRDLPTVQKEDTPVRKLEDELFDRLYAGGSEKVANASSAPLTAWAEKLHTLAEELPAFSRLAQDCQGDAFSSGTAVEKLMEALGPHLQSAPEQVQAPQLRRTMAKACEKSTHAIESQREAMEGLAGIGGGSGAGTGQLDPRQAKQLATRLKRDARLARIAMLAGKFKRIAAAKQKSKVRHGADEVSDVEMGSNTSRLLPSELAKLTHPLLRRAFLASLMEGRAMQYRLSGTDTLGRGPLVVCLDKSGSMEGARDIWATAVALALLEVAQRQRRPFVLLGFDERVKHEVIVEAGGQLPEAALFVGANGGTDVSRVIDRALTLIRESSGAMKKADVVLITDGESDRDQAASLKQQAAEMGVTTLGLGIGVEPESLLPWCDEVHGINRLDTVDETAAEALFTI